MTPDLNIDKTMFLTDLLQWLKLDINRFMIALTHGEPYETIIYLWIDKLYYKGKSKDEALNLILKAQRIHLQGILHN
ncbi:hypothetical protein ACFSTE_12030 [Aquimarina hainanensis]|uniref:Uncharacterized protein n=1 Tax=Aquimarina hainanensis TaxID=1578017 RepID=A0ABW5N7N9_9FLAO|nr:hypothetical protein [Aquimarina sp. TRL1]QKX05240.1 hypothetical protein HN014_10020 [Aquimarina sp. TRL1]